MTEKEERVRPLSRLFLLRLAHVGCLIWRVFPVSFGACLLVHLANPCCVRWRMCEFGFSYFRAAPTAVGGVDEKLSRLAHEVALSLIRLKSSDYDYALRQATRIEKSTESLAQCCPITESD